MRSPKCFKGRQGSLGSCATSRITKCCASGAKFGPVRQGPRGLTLTPANGRFDMFAFDHFEHSSALESLDLTAVLPPDTDYSQQQRVCVLSKLCGHSPHVMHPCILALTAFD